MNLDDNQARCVGNNEPVCTDCARRLQVERDAASERNLGWPKWLDPHSLWDYCEGHMKEALHDDAQMDVTVSRARTTSRTME